MMEAEKSRASSSFSAEWSEYLKLAAKRFAEHQREMEKLCRQSKEPYRRQCIRGLREAVMLSACRYSALKSWENSGTPNLSMHQMRKAVLGSGNLKTGIWALRRERCESLRVIMESNRRLVCPSRDQESAIALRHEKPTLAPNLSCIPKDILVLRAHRYRSYKICPASAAVLVAPLDIRPHASLQDCRGYKQHVERASEAFQRGERILKTRTPMVGGRTKVDTFDEVRRRYLGLPDEVYRRKTARRYAVWRRQRREYELRQEERLRNVENEMKRRRGHDMLMSSRSVGERSLAPFVFEQEENAYAFSSKISEAPKLREAMLRKYSSPAPQTVAPAMDSLQIARHAAETKALFHTRVMNRFS